MNKPQSFEAMGEFFSSSKFLNLCAFFGFALLMSIILASQNLLFQNIIENGISKKDIIAQRTITVIDTKRTEQHKREISQKVEPILAPAEDSFIKNNLETLESSILQIRKKDVPMSVKTSELSILFDISEGYRKEFVINYLLKTNENSVRQVFDKASLVLTNILSVGISEKDYENNNIRKIIHRNMVSNIPKSQSTVITELLEQVIVPNLIIDEDATTTAKKNAQDAVKPVEVVFEKGDKIVFEGEPVTQLKRDALRKAGYNVLEMNFKGFLGIFIIVLLTSLAFLKYLRTFEKQYIESSRIMIMGALSLAFALISILIPTGFSPYMLPMPAFIIILSIFTTPRIAMMLASLMLITLTLTLEYNIQFVLAFALINLISMITIAQVKFSRRFDLIKTGIDIALTSVVIVVSIYLLEKCLIEVDNALIVTDTAITFINCLLSGVIALGLLPLLESIFKIITPYGLAELADHNQPLMKRLQFEAPGTYHHSLMVSNLCEAAAESVGANPILARVGAFYHDIGKLKRPLFFVENQSYFGIENPHAKLNPRLSKMVITAHPKDGVELAKEYGLPPIIYNFILQHHGEGLASYFYTQAVAEEGAENVKEEQFRYTGPKPNMKETAILMIADAVESATRALKNPTPEEIETIIDKIIIERLNDGQLSDSPLTLRDIKTIAATFNRILRGMQHNRIKYHEDIVHELDKTKINIPMPDKVIDKELDEKIRQLEQGGNEKNDKK
ncbi:MAG TPA: HDIG domain-containing protein [Candidatus Gastranaerophilaceae bacterium]|nr:HDIG domain-containing protein [Candidatus Gastranaerophilaceae bacterium]